MEGLQTDNNGDNEQFRNCSLSPSFYKFWLCKTMHPAAIKYGLENDMIQFRGEKVVFSDEFLECISAARARDELGGKRINGSELLDGVVDRGLGETRSATAGTAGKPIRFTRTSMSSYSKQCFRTPNVQESATG